LENRTVIASHSAEIHYKLQFRGGQ